MEGRMNYSNHSDGRRTSSPAVRTASMAVHRSHSRLLDTPNTVPSRPPASDAPPFQRHLWMALGCAAFLLMVSFQWPQRQASQASTPNLPCQQVVQPQAGLSREALLQLLAVPERESAQVVRDIVHQPYCTLAPVELRAGVAAEREVFRLEFDPKTWLVILFEDDEYAGYAFQVNH